MRLDAQNDLICIPYKLLAKGASPSQAEWLLHGSGDLLRPHLQGDGLWSIEMIFPVLCVLCTLLPVVSDPILVVFPSKAWAEGGGVPRKQR